MFPAILIYHIISYIGTAVLLGGAAAVFLQARRGGADARALNILGFTLTAWGLVYLASCLNPQSVPLVDFQPMSVVTLTVGNLFVIICLFYPLELAQPGWTGWRNAMRLIFPYAAVTAFYFAVTALLGQGIRELLDIPDMLANLAEFHVWFRFILYLTVCAYLVYLLMNTGVRAIEFRHGGKPADRRRVRWLSVYGLGMIFITIAYLVVLLYGSVTSLIIHRLIAVFFFGLVIVNACIGSHASDAETISGT